MYRNSATGGSPLAAVFLVVALVLGTAGCGGGDHETVASVTISAAATELNEGEDRKPIRVTLTLSEAVAGAVTITLASKGSARLGSDFDLASAEVTVAAGSTQATTTITPIRDLEAEYDETITLEIASVAGRGEIGSTRSVDIVIRDLGTRQPQPPSVALEAFLLIHRLEAFLLIHRLEEDAVSFVVYVTNIGDVAASSTQAVLYTTTDDLFSSSPDLTSLYDRRVPGLGQGDWWLSDLIRVPFNDLVHGKTNYFYFCATAAPEQDPALVGCDAVDYTAVFLTDENRIPTTCEGFERDPKPETQDPVRASVVTRQHRPDVLRRQRRGGRPRPEHGADAGRRSNRPRRDRGRGGHRS